MTQLSSTSTTTFNYASPVVETVTVGATGYYDITAYGAQGGTAGGPSVHGKGGLGGSGKGAGLPGKGASFFGVKSVGTRICFVVDNSGSMKGPKWNTAVTELIAAVEKLNGKQAFYILFFSDKPLPMFSE